MGYDLEYLDYVDRRDIVDLFNEMTEYEGLFFTGSVAYEAFQRSGILCDVPMFTIQFDMTSAALSVLTTLVDFRDIPFERLYIDYIGMYTLFENSFIDMLPNQLVSNVSTLYSSDIFELTDDAYLMDITQKYNAGEIDHVIIGIAKVSKELEAMEIPFLQHEYKIDESVFNDLGKLIEEIEQFKNENYKNASLIIELKSDNIDKELSELCFELINGEKDSQPQIEGSYTIFRSKNSTKIDNKHESISKEIVEYLRKTGLEFTGGIGYGRTAIESEFNANDALDFASMFGQMTLFSLDDQRYIEGPINDPRFLRINEYSMKMIYTTARKLGIKNFNLCRLLALFESKNIVETEDLVNFLNISHNSSNRILKVLSTYDIVKPMKATKHAGAGRPAIKYEQVKKLL